MSAHNIYLLQHKKENHPKLDQICSYGFFSMGLKNEFETRSSGLFRKGKNSYYSEISYD